MKQNKLVYRLVEGNFVTRTEFKCKFKFRSLFLWYFIIRNSYMKFNVQEVEKNSELQELYYFIKYLLRLSGIFLYSGSLDIILVWASALQWITVCFSPLTVIIKTLKYQETVTIFSNISLRNFTVSEADRDEQQVIPFEHEVSM